MGSGCPCWLSHGRWVSPWVLGVPWALDVPLTVPLTVPRVPAGLLLRGVWWDALSQLALTLLPSFLLLLLAAVAAAALELAPCWRGVLRRGGALQGRVPRG